MYKATEVDFHVGFFFFIVAIAYWNDLIISPTCIFINYNITNTCKLLIHTVPIILTSPTAWIQRAVGPTHTYFRVHFMRVCDVVLASEVLLRIRDKGKWLDDIWSCDKLLHVKLQS